MTIATFTLDDADPAALRFPIVQKRHRIDVLRTLLQLEELEPDTPLLLEEQYVQKRDGLNLLLRLRLEPALVASRSPIYVRLQSPVEDHMRHHAKYAVLCSRGVALLSGDQEPSDVEPPGALTKKEGDDPLLSVLESLVVQRPSAQSRHDLANEWGPHRLWRGYAQLAGLKDEPEWARDAFLRLRQHEYYAYLLGLAALRSPHHTQPSEADAIAGYRKFLDGYRGPALRVLLLDDEIDKGWGDAVRAVLERPGVLEVNNDLAGVDFNAQRDRVAGIVDRGWDLVLADLRTTPGDRAQSPARGVRQYGGAAWIERIKGEHPETAVVAFTASNKAWSVQELRDMGVDGYWVKESPEFGVDAEYSEANAARLLTVVRESLEPRLEARPIWALRAALDRLVGDSSWVEAWVAPGKGPMGKLEVQGRLGAIRERMDRAYGFMTMNLSKHEENSFGLRRHDLAFLTMWSVLNEVDGLYFDGPQCTSRKDKLESRADAAFRWRNAWKTSHSRVPRSSDWDVYWRVQKGKVVQKPSRVPEHVKGEPVRDKVCPGHDGRPDWPGIGADTRRILWLLEAAGEPKLAGRFRSLRHLRNKLEEEHGKAGDRKEASLRDVHDICAVWEALLVTPYVRT